MQIQNIEALLRANSYPGRELFWADPRITGMPWRPISSWDAAKTPGTGSSLKRKTASVRRPKTPPK